jgi:hypothetical protein
MKNSTTYITSSLLISLALASSVQAGPIFPSKTIDLKLDGFCDGLHFMTNTTTGIVTGMRTGCESEATGGVVGEVLGKAQGGAVILDYTSFDLSVVIRDNRTWTYYNLNGTVFNSGTWSVGVAAAGAQGFSSTAK